MDPVTMSIAFGAVTGIVKGGISVFSRGREAEKAQTALKKEREKLTADLDRLQQNYDQSKLTVENQAQRNISNLNWNIDYTSDARASKASSNSYTAITKQKDLYRDLTRVLANASDTEGKLKQSLATTGARYSGTSLERQRQLEGENQVNIASAVDNTKLTSFQMASEAVNNYWSYSKQVESYQNNIMDAKAERDETLKSLLLQYEQQKADIEYNIDLVDTKYEESKYSIGDIFLDLLSFGMNIGSNAYDSYMSGKRQEKTDLYYQELEKYAKEDLIG